jgi:hypothetical protein
MAAVVYFLVVTPYNKLQERMSRGDEPAPPAPDIALLTEIRDLLAAGPQSDSAARVGGRDVQVLAIPRAGPESPGLTSGALVVLGVPDITAQTAAQASVTAFLSVVLTR